MNPSLEQLGIDRMSVTERIELIGAIWDTLPNSGEDLPIPEWHLREVERRRASAEADPDAAIPWDEVKARLTNRP